MPGVNESSSGALKKGRLKKFGQFLDGTFN